MFKSFKALDGYNLGTQTDGYTCVSPWIDLHTASLFSAIAVFSGDAIANGTLKLQMSNDDSDFRIDADGRRFPQSASSSITDASDTADVPASLTGTVTQTISATGKYVFQQIHFPGRWIRFHFVKTGAPAGNTLLNIFCHFKSE